MTRPCLFQFLLGMIANLLITVGAIAQPVIKFDGTGKTPWPFDRPFFLQAEFKGGDVTKVSVFEIKYVNGEREIVDPDYNKLKVYRPSFVLMQPLIGQKAGMLTMEIPALKPDKHFDILIESGLSEENTQRAYDIIREIRKRPHMSLDSLNKVAAIGDALRSLYHKVNSRVGKTERIVFDFDLQRFKAELSDPLGPDIDLVTADARSLQLPPALTKEETDELHACASQEIITGYHFSVLIHLMDRAVYESVLTGELPVNAFHASGKIDPYDLHGRVENISRTLAYLDTLDRAVAILKTTSPAYHAVLSGKLRSWSDWLVTRRKLIQDKQKVINSFIQSICRESMWLTQGTQSPDLATTGSRHVTVDAGFLTLAVKDNQSKWQGIPKLFLGLNIYFRSYDKSTNFNDFTIPPKGDSTISHHLESRRTAWRWLSLTAGFTLGAYQNKDFDNVYSGLSFTLGPSVRLGKLRVGAGGAVIKRTSVNPVITRSDLTLGWYGSISLDFDLLTAAAKIASKFF